MTSLILALIVTTLSMGAQAPIPGAKTTKPNLPAVTAPATTKPSGTVLAPPTTVGAEDPQEPEVHLGLEDASKDIYIAQHFSLILSIINKPGMLVTLPSRIVGGPRFEVIGAPKKLSTERLDSGKEKTTWRITLSSFMTDRLIDRKLERVNTRMKRREADLSEAKTILTETRLANKDTTDISKRVAAIEQRISSDKSELQALKRKYELHPIPISFKKDDGTMGVVRSHEWGLGPKIIISSKLANEPNPQLKEPASEENRKAGGPFWKPYSLYEENTTLKNVLWGILIGLLILALLVPLGLYIVKKRRREAPPPPPKPAHETAFTRLDALKSRGLPEDEETKDFAFELSEIMREYCGNRYHFYSLEMTTTELLQKLSEMHPAGLPFDALSEYFDTLDLVKFAKMPLQPAEFPPELEKGYEFVRETMKGDSPELTDEQEENPEVNAPVGAGMTHTLDDSLGDEDARYLPPGTLETPMTPEPEDAREEKVTTGSEETPAPRPPEPETSEETPAAPTDDTESKYLPPPPDIEPVETVTPPQEPESPEESPGSPQEESDREDHRWDGSGSPKDKE